MKECKRPLCRSPLKMMILETLAGAKEPVAVNAIASLVEKGFTSVHNALMRLDGEGMVEKVRGKPPCRVGWKITTKGKVRLSIAISVIHVG